MNTNFIKFASVTTAQKAQRLLSENGWQVRLGKNPGYERGESCSYALFLSSGIQDAVRLLENNSIPFKGVGEVKNRGLSR